MKNVGTYIYTKEDFLRSIKQIKAWHDRDQECLAAFKVLLPDDYITGYSNFYILDELLEILKVAMNDVEGSWIDYYIWELNFGQKFRDGMVKEDGINIKLETPEYLWNLLTNNK